MKRALLICALLICICAMARADGGRLQLRQAAGPFVVSLFTVPESPAVGPLDLSVLVEDRASNAVVLHADITLTLTPDGGGEPIVAHFTHAQTTDRLLQHAIVNLPHGGRWRAVMQVRDAAGEGGLATELTVAGRSTQRGTVWFFALLPLAASAFFVWVQRLQRRRGKPAQQAA